jgi:hypothetical protein
VSKIDPGPACIAEDEFTAPDKDTTARRNLRLVWNLEFSSLGSSSLGN